MVPMPGRVERKRERERDHNRASPSQKLCMTACLQLIFFFTTIGMEKKMKFYGKLKEVEVGNPTCSSPLLSLLLFLIQP